MFFPCLLAYPVSPAIVEENSAYSKMRLTFSRGDPVMFLSAHGSLSTSTPSSRLQYVRARVCMIDSSRAFTSECGVEEALGSRGSVGNNSIEEGARRWGREEVDAAMLLQTNKYIIYSMPVCSSMGDLVTWKLARISKCDTWVWTAELYQQGVSVTVM